MTNRLTPYGEYLILRILLAEKRMQHPHAFSQTHHLQPPADIAASPRDGMEFFS